RDKSPVLFTVDGVEINRGRHVADAGFGPDQFKLRLAQAARQDRNRKAMTRSGFAPSAKKSVTGPTDQRVEYNRGTLIKSCPNQMRQIDIAEREDPLSDDQAARGLHDFPQHAVRFPRPYVVGANAEHVAPDRFDHMARKGNDMLVRRRADVD